MRRQKKWLIGGLIGAFDKHLRNVCGVSESTRGKYIRYAEEFLRRQCAVGKCADLRVLDAVTLNGCLTPYAGDYRPATLKLVASALRAFLRFLQFRGLAEATLIGAIPTIAHPYQGNLPTALSVVEAKTLLGVFDRSTARGQRDYAMVRCMLGLGLRAKEVAGLTLEDIDWRNAVVRLAHTKGRRSDQLPLAPVVGRAIAAYLRHGRPPTAARELFVRHVQPVGQPLLGPTVSKAVRRAFQRADVHSAQQGSHILRRTLATRLLQRGASIKLIADVLRHRSLDTTRNYTRVDLAALRPVALPWPEVRP